MASCHVIGGRQISLAFPVITFPVNGSVLTSTTNFTLTGCSPNNPVRIYDGATLVASGTAAADGTATISVALAQSEGGHTYYAASVVGGVEGAHSSGTTVIVGIILGAVLNANTVSAIGLRSALKARVPVSWLPTGSFVMRASADGGYGSFNWLVDTYLQAVAWPNIYTPSYARPIIDQYATAVTNSVWPQAIAFGIDTTGTALYGTESGSGPAGPTMYWPPLDEPANLTLLTALMHDRGDTTVFPTHKTRLMAGLDTAPRSNGLVAVPATRTVNWAKEDAIVYPSGGTAMPSILTAIAYKEVSRLATVTGDTALAADASAKLGTMTASLAALRRSSPDFVGFYNASEAVSEAKPHIVATALMVIHDLCDTQANRDASAQALVTAFQSGTIDVTNGSIRYLAAPYTASNVRSDITGTLATNVKTISWWTEFAGWTARAMSLAPSGTGTGSAMALLSQSSYEMLRQQRATSDAPWEALLTNPIEVVDIKKYYAEAVSFLTYATDAPPTIASQTLSLSGGYSASIDLNQVGHRVTGLDVSGTNTGTFVVEVLGTPRTDLAIVLNPVPVTYSAETATPIASVTLSGAFTASVTTGSVPDRSVYGGKLRVRVRPAVNDSFSTDTSANYTDLGVGTAHTASAGVLKAWTTLNPYGSVYCNAPPVFADGAIQADLSHSSATGDLGLILRLTDNDNYLLAYRNSAAVSIYRRVTGTFVQMGTFATASNTTNKATLLFEVIGDNAKLWLNGTLRVTASGLVVTGSGRPGILVQSGTTSGFPQFADNLSVWSNVTGTVTVGVRQDAISPTLVSMSAALAQPVPPGYVVEIGGIGGTYCITGDDYTTVQVSGSGVVLYDWRAIPIATGTVPGDGNKLGVVY